MPRQLIYFALLLGLLSCALGISWWLHAQFNYGYALWYDWLDLRAQIAEFGPQNRYILGFDTLTPTAQQAAFNAIVHAVHNQGVGLAEIQFTDAYGQTKALLRDPEVVHLDDVAKLITQLKLGLLWLAPTTFVGLMLMRRHVIRWRWQVALLLMLFASVCAMLVVLGFEAVFYQLHRWVFPIGHEWFFYYQDSLMSTMMKAPDLFAGIGASLVGGGLIIFAVMLKVLKIRQ